MIKKTLHNLSSNGAKYSMHNNDETFRKKLFLYEQAIRIPMYLTQHIYVINIQELSRCMVPQTWGLSQATMCNIVKHYL